MVEPFAGSSAMTRAIETKPSWYHLRDGVVEGAVEGFYVYNLTEKKIIY